MCNLGVSQMPHGMSGVVSFSSVTERSKMRGHTPGHQNATTQTQRYAPAEKKKAADACVGMSA